MDTSIFHAGHFDLSRVSCKQTLSIDMLFVFPFVVCCIFNHLILDMFIRTFQNHILLYCLTLLTRLDSIAICKCLVKMQETTLWFK